MGVCADLLERGHAVELVTLEHAPVRAAVPNLAVLGRRLAAARCGAPIDGPIDALVLRTDGDEASEVVSYGTEAWDPTTLPNARRDGPGYEAMRLLGRRS
jgi:hypothetical protein